MRNLLKASLLATTLLLTSCTGIPEGLTPVQPFELNRYLGEWHEIARLDHSFERGMMDVSATYQRQNQDFSLPINPITKAWLLGLNYNIGAGMVRAGFGRKTPDNVLNSPAIAKTKQFSLGYDYNLSKRTALYGTYAFLKNQKSETFSVSANGLGIATPAGGKNQNALTVGIRHAF